METIPSLQQLQSLNKTNRILIVDDEPINRVLLRRILLSHGEIVEASDGFEALKLIRAESFDIILLDIMMPRFNGLDVLAEIRTEFSNWALPVILISALAENENIVNGLKAGANDYIPKPIDGSVVQARVQIQLQLKAAYDMQQMAIEEMKKAATLKNRLLSIASHDLKAPLSSVFMAESLLREISTDPMAFSILDTMKLTLTSMHHIITEFLDMAAIQSQKVDIHLNKIELEDVIFEVLTYYEMPAMDKGSTFKLGNTQGQVIGDYARLVQVLGNLVSNALKYSPPNSEITVNVAQDGDSYVLEVIDQGPGIPENEMGQLFTEFSKLTPRPTANENSTGLGLWIVKQMVDMMNGEVGVHCPDEGGSIFWVRIPSA